MSSELTEYKDPNRRDPYIQVIFKAFASERKPTLNVHIISNLGQNWSWPNQGNNLHLVRGLKNVLKR